MRVDELNSADMFYFGLSQGNEDSLVYSVPKFTKTKFGKAGRRKAAAKEETIYTDVWSFEAEA